MSKSDVNLCFQQACCYSNHTDPSMLFCSGANAIAAFCAPPISSRMAAIFTYSLAMLISKMPTKRWSAAGLVSDMASAWRTREGALLPSRFLKWCSISHAPPPPNVRGPVNVWAEAADYGVCQPPPPPGYVCTLWSIRNTAGPAERICNTAAKIQNNYQSFLTAQQYSAQWYEGG